MAKPRLLVSACLLGVRCRYNGEGGSPDALFERLAELAELIPVCPEILGGLPTPRPPAERRGDRVVNCEGGDETDAYRRGAEEVLRLNALFGARYALMKERSPSCGAGEIYDGSFCRVRVSGDGVAAALLKANGVRVFGETAVDALIAAMRKEEGK